MIHSILYITTLSVWMSFSAAVPVDNPGTNGELYLTPYIETNRLEEARKMARVNDLDSRVTSYSGLLTVNKDYGSNLFFWYFPSERKASKVPLLLWLNGFSTASSYGIFLQNGPFDLTGRTLVARNTSWQQFYHVLYIDNPVGVGFSFTLNPSGYSKTLEEVSKNLQNALWQFLHLFPELTSHELYITGISLGGKYVSSLAYRIYQNQFFPLKGIFLGNPLIDPPIQLNYGDYLMQLGFIDEIQEKQIVEMEKEIDKNLKDKNYNKVYQEAAALMLSNTSYILNVTGLRSVFDYNSPFVQEKHYKAYIRRPEVKKAVHVGNLSFNNGMLAMSLFASGFATPVTGWLEEMVETISMLFYAGQMDVACAYPMLVQALKSMNWSGKADYANADRHLLYDDDSNYVWGYLRNYKTLTDVMVRKAGHSAITNQPDHILSLLHNFTKYHRFN